MFQIINRPRRSLGCVAILLMLGGAAGGLPVALAAQEETPESDRRCICVDQGAVAWADAARQLRIVRERPVLGVMLGTPRGDHGVRLDGVTEDGPAQKAGLRAGDVLTAIDDLDLTDREAEEAADALVDYLAQEVEPGDTVAVVYERGGDIRRASIVTEAGGARALALTVGPGGHVTMRPALRVLPELDFDVMTPSAPIVAAAPEAAREVLIRRITGGGLFGLRLADMNAGLGSYFGTERGVLVLEVDDDSALGLRAGDVILRIGGREIENANHASRILQSYRDDEPVELDIMRDRRQTVVTGTVR